ncbi:hypothetical protein LT493_10225 [Streptomyces tricolor]|nr:hypothetical protein [Streptomyces tricolor]
MVCHAPAALLAATGEDGANAFAGYQVAAPHQRRGESVGLRRPGQVATQDRLTEAGVWVWPASRGAARGGRPQPGHQTSPPPPRSPPNC